LNALCLELIGNAVQSCGEYTEPPTQQNHTRSGRERKFGTQDENCHDGEACAGSCCEDATLGRAGELIICFVSVFLSDLCHYRSQHANCPHPVLVHQPSCASLKGADHA